MSITSKLKDTYRKANIWSAIRSLQTEILSHKAETANLKYDLVVMKQTTEELKMQLGDIQSQRVRAMGEIGSLAEAEFKVFSQFGQDGILQYLISKVEIPNKIFIEFGVQTYFESTTRFLLMHDRWSGLIMDGDQSYMDMLATTDMYWQYDLTSK